MKMKLMQMILVTVAVMAYSKLQAAQVKTGIPAADLKIDCHGELIVTSYDGVGKTSGFTDRGGNYHPASGYAKLHYMLQNLNSGCAEMKEKLGVDVTALKFKSTFFTDATDPVIVAQQAAAQIGEVKKMKAEQYFMYQDENGNLPFYPLMHSETVTVDNQHIQVDTAKAYNIWLYEESKVQLTEMILKYLQQNDSKKLLYSPLMGALVDHLPEFENNLKVYLPQVLSIFTQLEENHVITGNGTNWNFNLSALAADINSHTHKYPAYYQLKIQQLVSQHPSMLDIYSNNSVQAFPNMSAQDLEAVVDLIEGQLAEGQMNTNVKAAYKEKLKYMAGHFSPGGKLGNLASKYVKQKAQEILKNYY
jgi:hypothetical protein